ncbi:MAG: GNAT family N-acetyltransferase [Pseudomonadota bacterium]
MPFFNSAYRTETRSSVSDEAQSTAVTKWIEPDNALTLRMIDTIEELDRHELAWRELFEIHASTHQMFQSFAWTRTWATYYLNQRRFDALALAIVVVWSGNRLVLVLPLAVYRFSGLRILRCLGAPVSQYGDALVDRTVVDDVTVCRALSLAIEQTQCDVVDLRKVRHDAEIRPALEALGAVVVHRAQAPFVDLAQAVDREGYWKWFSGQARKQRRKRRRQLAEIGPLKFATLEAGCCAAIEARQAIAMKRKALSASGRLSLIVHDDRFEQFFVDLARVCDRGAQVRVSILSCGDHVIAREIGIVCKRGYAAHVGVFDPEYARFAPGRLQIDDKIEHCLEEGLLTFDFLAPEDDYKWEFADAAVPVLDYALVVTTRGAMFDRLVVRGALPLVRSMKNVLPSLRPKVVAAHLYSALRLGKA